jgi:hypothetical protein
MNFSVSSFAASNWFHVRAAKAMSVSAQHQPYRDWRFIKDWRAFSRASRIEA